MGRWNIGWITNRSVLPRRHTKFSLMVVSVSREVEDSPRKETTRRARRRTLEKRDRAVLMKGRLQQKYLQRTASLLRLVEVVVMEVADTGEVGATMAAVEITAVADGEGTEMAEAAAVETTTAGEGQKEDETKTIIRAEERIAWIIMLPRGMIQATRRNQRDTLIILR
jgi:hypothetical protein